MTHATLVDIGCKWLGRKCAIVFSEFATYTGETPDVIGWHNGQSTLIECKISRSDFHRDKHKSHRRREQAGMSDLGGMGARRYYLSPAGVLQLEDMPDGYGLLAASGSKVTVLRPATALPGYNRQHEIVYLVSMLRRAQIRLGSRKLRDWLRLENKNEWLSGNPPNATTGPADDERTKQL